jgi:hypothetical protein
MKKIGGGEVSFDGGGVLSTRRRTHSPFMSRDFRRGCPHRIVFNASKRSYKILYPCPPCNHECCLQALHTTIFFVFLQKSHEMSFFSPKVFFLFEHSSPKGNGTKRGLGLSCAESWIIGSDHLFLFGRSHLANIPFLFCHILFSCLGGLF